MSSFGGMVSLPSEALSRFPSLILGRAAVLLLPFFPSFGVGVSAWRGGNPNPEKESQLQDQEGRPGWEGQRRRGGSRGAACPPPPLGWCCCCRLSPSSKWCCRSHISIFWCYYPSFFRFALPFLPSSATRGKSAVGVRPPRRSGGLLADRATYPSDGNRSSFFLMVPIIHKIQHCKRQGKRQDVLAPTRAEPRCSCYPKESPNSIRRDAWSRRDAANVGGWHALPTDT